MCKNGANKPAATGFINQIAGKYRIVTSKTDKNGDPQIIWDDNGNPFCKTYGDHFYSCDDGRAESRHVFIHGNKLHRRLQTCKHLTIAELGFGTGLNFLETWHCWRKIRQPDQQLQFVSFELHPLSGDTIRRALSQWPELATLGEMLLTGWSNRASAPGPWQLDAQTSLHVYFGEAGAMLDCWDGKANAWYLDGFSPQKNSAMWSASLMQNVYDHTNSNGTFATYTSAGWVRRNLQAAGFNVSRSAGHGSKRHMSIGVKL